MSGYALAGSNAFGASRVFAEHWRSLLVLQPMADAPSLWNKGYVATKGAGHTQWTKDWQYYDPILKTYKTPIAGKVNRCVEGRHIVFQQRASAVMALSTLNLKFDYLADKAKAVWRTGL